MSETMEMTLIAGQSFIQTDQPWTNYRVYVNLSEFDGKYVVEVYDADMGGPIDHWVDEVFDTFEDALAEYEERVDEVEENSPAYVTNVWSDPQE